MEKHYLVNSLPTSSFEILKLLIIYEKLTVAEIVDLLTSQNVATERHIKYAIRRLLAYGLLIQEPNLSDMRNLYYRLIREEDSNIILERFSRSLRKEVHHILLTKKLEH